MKNFVLSEKMFLLLLFFVKRGRNRLRTMSLNLNTYLYELTEIVYVFEDGSRVSGNGQDELLPGGKKNPRYNSLRSKQVICSAYFTKEHGEPSLDELSDLMGRKRTAIRHYKQERSAKMKRFEYIFIGFIGFVVFKLLLPEYVEFIESLLEESIPGVVSYVYYIVLAICYFLISNIKRNIVALRRKAYRNHFILLYLERVYGHRVAQATTVARQITYDRDGFPKNLYSSSLIDLVNISLGQIALILFCVLGVFLF